MATGSPRENTLRYLRDHHVLSLATGIEGRIWSAAVFYVNDGFNIYFLSAGHTRHAQNCAQNPQVSATIQEDYTDWPTIKGIQLAGEVAQLSGDAQEKAIAIYLEKYPFLAQENEQIQHALTRVNWYQLQPTELYFIDNAKGFGHRDQIDV